MACGYGMFSGVRRKKVKQLPVGLMALLRRASH